MRTVQVDASSFVVDGLTPSTDYSYCIVADDGVYGSADSERIYVRTLDPTFDYFAPVACAPGMLTPTSLVATWEEMDGATEYFLTVHGKYEGERFSEYCGFDSGLDNLPIAWSTNAVATYGMNSYSGKSVPSLRMSKNGEELLVGELSDKRLDRISFWHRGNGTTGQEALLLQGLKGGKWTILASYPVVTEKGGATYSYDNGCAPIEAVRLVFDRPSSGAVAVDDVSLEFAGPLLDYILPDYDRRSAGNALSMPVSGLTPGSPYSYTVSASDGEFYSLMSDPVEVVTPFESGVGQVNVADMSSAIRVNGLEVSSGLPFDVYTPAGLRVASGVKSATLPCAGLYVIVPVGGGSAVKVAAF